MSVVTTDLISLASANMPEDDTTLNGGAIDANSRVVFTQLAANDKVSIVSSAAGDTTQTATIYGRDAGGGAISEVLALNGVTPVNGTLTYERITKVILSAAAAGVVTVSRFTTPFTTIVAIPIGVVNIYSLFINAASASTPITRYAKVFCKNTNATTTLDTAAIKLTADPAAVIRIGAASAKNDTGTAANRVTTPAGVTFVDDGVSQAVPTGLLAAGETIGVWIEQALAGGAAAIKSTFTLELSGTTV